MAIPSFFLFTLALSAVSVTSFQIFPADSVSSYPSSCAAVLSQNITSCSNVVEVFDPDTTYNQDTLEQSCNSTCSSALSAWFNQASDACGNVTYLNDYGDFAAVSSVIGEISYNFNQTCLTYKGQYCNVVLGDLATSNSSNSTTGGESTGAGPCNYCDLLKLKNTAESPYDDGPLVYSQSLYQSYTSACGYTGQPLTTHAPSATVSGSAFGNASQTVSATPTACTGSTYTIKSGDTCNSISLSQGTATWWLLMDNDLPAYCANFPKSGSLCINHPCKTYTTKSGDSCNSVAQANNITVTQLQAYNPWIDFGCYNFNKTIGTQICVNEPGQKYIPPTTAIGSPSVAVSSVPVPTNVAANTTTKCGLYYQVVAGDYCDKVILKYSISLTDFLILNPAVNPNCTNLFAGESYCVEPVGSINNYPGSPFYDGNTTSATGPPFSSLPNATYVPILPLNKLPLAPGTVQNCSKYANGQDLKFGLDGVSDCSAAEFMFGATVSQLSTWNPSLNTNSSNCTFDVDYRYCIWQPQPIWVPSISTYTFPSNTSTASATSNSRTASPTTTSTSTTKTAKTTSATSSSTAAPSPTQSGSVALNCNSYAKTSSGDYCAKFASDNNISADQLYDWNSVLGVNGSNCNTELFANYYYCIGVDIPSPIQQNSIPGNCDIYGEAISGDYCSKFAQDNNITTSQLYDWNAVLGSSGENCNTEFFANYYYCIGVNGQLSG